MYLKILTFCFALVLLTTLSASAGHVTREMISNRWEVQLPRGDFATLYMNSDYSFTFMPTFSNQDNVRICWGRWDFDEEKQLLEIKSGSKRCRIILGKYRVSRQHNYMVLDDGIKRHVFRYLVER